MPTVEENLAAWNDGYDWVLECDEWSAGWGGVDTPRRRPADLPLMAGTVTGVGFDVQAGVFVPYLRCAACFETPSIAPISDQDRWAARAA